MATITLIINAFTPMPKPTGERGFKASEIGQLLGRPALYMLALLLQVFFFLTPQTSISFIIV